MCTRSRKWRVTNPIVAVLFVALGLLTHCTSQDVNEDSTCKIACTRELAPVCGEYQGIQKTFPNFCIMTYRNCLDQTDFKLLAKAPCLGEVEG